MFSVYSALTAHNTDWKEIYNWKLYQFSEGAKNENRKYFSFGVETMAAFDKMKHL